MLLFGALKTAAGATLMATLALLFYGFGVLSIGPALVPFMVLLVVMGWVPGCDLHRDRHPLRGYVFENMRTVLAGGTPDWSALAVAGVLDVAYVGVAVAYLAGALRYARRRGHLSRFGD